MIFYDVTSKYEAIKEESSAEKEYNNMELPFQSRSSFYATDLSDGVPKTLMSAINKTLGIKCALNENVSAFAYNGMKNELRLVVAIDSYKISFSKAWKEICRIVKDAEVVILSNKVKKTEISAKDVAIYEDKADNNNVVSFQGSFTYRLGMEYFNNHCFKVNENCIVEKASYNHIVKEAKDIMGDATLFDEIDRIYSPNNVKKFYGHPVHYLIRTENTEDSKAIKDILIKSLNENKRLVGHRIINISKITHNCYEDEDFNSLFRNAAGNVIVIDMSAGEESRGSYASVYEEVTNELAEKINNYKLDTLFILLQSTQNVGFSDSLLGKIVDTVDIVEINEGDGDPSCAVDYFLNLSANDDKPATREEALEALPKKKRYLASEVCNAYREWYSSSLKERFYKEYKSIKALTVDDKHKTESSYEELQRMVGLTEIKEVVDEIIATGKMNKLRKRSGIKENKTSMHMIFTGNPGSAKTSVARLLADILCEEDVLESSRVIECGRADLVGKYVGWTAKIVKSKFRAAKGGILFIDEAYALADDSNSFGEEAINTIVQEMENNRDNVMVIFAGYPDKMEKFLEKNEGLRSRIAFHLNFPDYKPDEMYRILEIMAEDRDLLLSNEIKDKCIDIFDVACRKAEFGNGRFARNLIEQAQMRQSKRLMKEYNGKKVPKSKLKELVADDFEVNAGKCYKSDAKAFGFAG